MSTYSFVRRWTHVARAHRHTHTHEIHGRARARAHLGHTYDTTSLNRGKRRVRVILTSSFGRGRRWSDGATVGSIRDGHGIVTNRRRKPLPEQTRESLLNRIRQITTVMSYWICIYIICMRRVRCLHSDFFLSHFLYSYIQHVNETYNILSI